MNNNNNMYLHRALNLSRSWALLYGLSPSSVFSHNVLCSHYRSMYTVYINIPQAPLAFQLSQFVEIDIKDHTNISHSSLNENTKFYNTLTFQIKSSVLIFLAAFNLLSPGQRTLHLLKPKHICSEV